jgi:hypothetical protein
MLEGIHEGIGFLFVNRIIALSLVELLGATGDEPQVSVVIHL